MSLAARVSKPIGETGTASPIVIVPQPALQEIEAHYDRGQMLKAWAVAQRYGPLERWQGVRAVVWAGRLAANLGARRLSNVLHWRNWRQYPQDAEAAAYWVHSVLERRGPLRALELLDKVGDLGGAEEVEGRLYLASLKAVVAGEFRDFEAANRYLDRAREVLPNHRWLDVVESGLLERQDRYEEALAAVRRCVSEDQCYRPGVQVVAHLLQVLDREEEALQWLRQAASRMESGPVVGQLAALEMELGNHEETLKQYERFEEVSPIADKAVLESVQRSRVTVACRMGDHSRARRWLAGLQDTYHLELTKRLEDKDPPHRRVQLSVDFVRQHHMTCAPATLTALSRYWKRPVSHLEVAEKICYDGTPAHSERQWAESQGYVVREFTVTWEAAVSLLDRGVPFTLTTTEITSGHLQAVVGYDELRRSLLLRDPFLYHLSEALCPEFLERQAATGPRGLAIVPATEVARLETAQLPDTGLYDQLHRLNGALDRHDRDTAVAVLAEMEQSAAEHRLTWTAARTLAVYDANGAALLRSVNGLLTLHPEHPHLNLVKVSCLAEQAGRTERIAFLEKVCEQAHPDPLFHVRLAAELREDARERERARHLARWALRFRPTDPEFLKTYADVLWDERAFEKAARLYRLAACMADKSEACFRSYFGAARFLQQQVEVIEFMRRRFNALGHQSPCPAVTLVDALISSERVIEALDVLQQALTKRPEDGDLLLFAADTYARLGKYPESESYLKQAEGRTRRTNWLRSAGTLATYQCDRQRALGQWREVLTLEPLAMDANRMVAILMAETEGWQAARRFLEETCTRFPAHCGLLGLRVEFLREAGPSAMEPALRQLLAANPADAWAHRELALQLAQLQRFEEALALADHAIDLDGNSPQGFSTRGDIRLRLGQRVGARRDFERAISLAVDSGYAIEKLLETCQTAEERREALSLIERHLAQQVVFGEGLAAYRGVARGVLGPEAVLARLQEARRARPDLWMAWSMEINQLSDMDRLEEAEALAEQALQRFAYLPRIRWDRARVHHLRSALDKAVAELQIALSINPAFGDASRYLAELATNLGDLELGRRTLEQACAHAPLDFLNHGGWASALWALGRKQEALERMQHAIRLEPGYEWGWQRLQDWSGQLNQSTLATTLARELTQRRPGEARSWLLLAECLAGERDGELEKVLDRALELNPQAVDAYDLKARWLFDQNRVEEALACCRPTAWLEAPVSLRIREAWIEAQRGRLQVAILKIQELVRNHDTHYGAWQLLADWHAHLQQWKEATAAADRMSELAPQNPVPLGYAGEFCLKQQDSNGAVARFRRAFALDPTYQFGGFSLFDLLVQGEDLVEAAEVLSKLKMHAEFELVTAREAQLAARQGQREVALGLFASLCSRQTKGSWCLVATLDALRQCGQLKAADRMIQEALASPTPNVWLGSAYVLRRFERKQYRLTGSLEQLLERGELGRNTAVTYLDLLAEHYLQSAGGRDVFLASTLQRQFRKLLRRHRALLHGDDLTWGKTGYVLATLGDNRRVVDWLRDWPKRQGVEPWMLYNLALGLELTGRPDEALDVLRVGVSWRQAPDLFGSFAILTAFEELIHSQIVKGRELIAAVSENQISVLDKALLGLAQALALGAGAGSADLRELSRQVRTAIRGGLSGIAPFRHHALVRRAYRRCLNHFARVYGLKPFPLRGWLHYYGLQK